ncbi:MAG: DUF1211 domain-containing protein [Anaerolineae bacterium]|nr:DUF1211 domain-containing protein [Anaerolineae bacterium]
MTESHPAGDKQLERIIFFSDAIFAIAITLLVLEIRVPELEPARAAAELGGALLALAPKYFSYFISFMAIGVYWTAHHRLFQYIVRYDRRLIWLNLLLMLCIAFLPFPTAVMGAYYDVPVAIVFYAASVGVTGLVRALLWWYAASGYRLLDPKTDPAIVRLETERGLVTPLVFFASILIVPFSITLATLSWTLTLVLTLLIRQPHEPVHPKR